MWLSEAWSRQSINGLRWIGTDPSQMRLTVCNALRYLPYATL